VLHPVKRAFPPFPLGLFVHPFFASFFLSEAEDDLLSPSNKTLSYACHNILHEGSVRSLLQSCICVKTYEGTLSHVVLVFLSFLVGLVSHQPLASRPASQKETTIGRPAFLKHRSFSYGFLTSLILRGQ